jgi:hypothetical protein
MSKVRFPRFRKKGKSFYLLSSAYQHAMVNAGLTFNPCIGVKSTQPRSRRDRYITDAELVAVRGSASPLLQVAIDLAWA